MSLNKMSFDSKKEMPISSKTGTIITNFDDYAKDQMFRVVFSEQKAALKFIQLLIPFSLYHDDSRMSYLLCNGIDFLNKTAEEKDAGLETIPEENAYIEDKGIRFNVMFDYRSGVTKKDIFSINLNMEKEHPNTGNLTMRAVRNAAGTFYNLLKTGKNYNELRKVYSIWFLEFNYFNDNKVVHSMGLKSFYNQNGEVLTKDIGDQSIHAYDPAVDLMEVVFIELPKIDLISENLEFKQFLYALTGKLDNIETFMELFEMTRQEVATMLKRRSILQMTREEGIEQGVEQIVRIMLKNGIPPKQISLETKIPIVKVIDIKSKYNL